GIQVMDLGSGNGVWLDGMRLTPNIPTTLADGSSFTIGRVRFVLRILTQSGAESVDGGVTNLKPPSVIAPTNALTPHIARDQASPSLPPRPPGPKAVASAAVVPAMQLRTPNPAEPRSTPVVVTSQPPQIPTNVDPVDADIEAGEAKTFVVTV